MPGHILKPTHSGLWGWAQTVGIFYPTNMQPRLATCEVISLVLSWGCSALESIFFQISFPLSFSPPCPIHPNSLWELPLQEHKVEYLQSWLSAGDNPLPYRGHLAMSEGIFSCHPWGSNRRNPGMLLNIFNEEDRTPLTAPQHTHNKYSGQSVSSAEVENPWSTGRDSGLKWP